MVASPKEVGLTQLVLKWFLPLLLRPIIYPSEHGFFAIPYAYWTTRISSLATKARFVNIHGFGGLAHCLFYLHLLLLLFVQLAAFLSCLYYPTVSALCSFFAFLGSGHCLTRVCLWFVACRQLASRHLLTSKPPRLLVFLPNFSSHVSGISPDFLPGLINRLPSLLYFVASLLLSILFFHPKSIWV